MAIGNSKAAANVKGDCLYMPIMLLVIELLVIGLLIRGSRLIAPLASRCPRSETGLRRG
jgi:hypothetical protein